jgi:hypothetical protein
VVVKKRVADFVFVFCWSLSHGVDYINGVSMWITQLDTINEIAKIKVLARTTLQDVGVLA